MTHAMIDNLTMLPPVRPGVLILGDIIFDEYVNVMPIPGKTERPGMPAYRISNPNPEIVLGGAGNVAANVASLGGGDIQTCLVSLIGPNDEDDFSEALNKLEINSVYSYVDSQYGDPERWVCRKRRYRDNSNNGFRVDLDCLWPIEDHEALRLASTSIEMMDVHNIKVVVLSDYDKGILTPDLCQLVIKAANKKSIPVLVDPKGDDWLKYTGATCIKANNKEDREHAPRASLKQITKYYIRTLGKDGLEIASPDGPGFSNSRTFFRSAGSLNAAIDATGAGDSVIAALAVCLAEGRPMREAARFANVAASIAVEHRGTYAVTRTEWEARLESLTALPAKVETSTS